MQEHDIVGADRRKPGGAGASSQHLVEGQLTRRGRFVKEDQPVAAPFRRQRPHHVKESLLNERDPGAGIVDVVGELGAAQQVVQGHCNEACLGDGKEQLDILQAVIRKNPDPVALHQALGHHPPGQAVTALIEFAERALLIPKADGDLIGAAQRQA